MTKIIDTAVKTRASNYIGPGTLDGNCETNLGAGTHKVFGYFTSTNEAVVLNCGFTARKVRVVNDTDAIVWEKQLGMGASASIKTVLGGSLAATRDTGSAILIGTDGTVTLSSTLCGSAKVITFEIEG